MARYTTESGGYYGPMWHLWRASGESRFPLYDGAGSVHRLVDSSNNHTDIYELAAFGQVRSSTITTPNPYRFGGAWGYITDPSGLQQLGARFYWPELGRFIQQDPIGDGMNWYAYVGNNPIMAVDPSGLWAKCKHGELADDASENSGLTPEQQDLLKQGAEGPDTKFWATVRAARWPHFGEDRSEESLEKAVSLWNEGKEEKALDTLGWGLHNLADIQVHPKKPLDHIKPGFSEDPAVRKSEWAEAQRRSRDLVRRFREATQSPSPTTSESQGGGGNPSSGGGNSGQFSTGGGGGGGGGSSGCQ